MYDPEAVHTDCGQKSIRLGYTEPVTLIPYRTTIYTVFQRCGIIPRYDLSHYRSFFRRHWFWNSPKVSWRL
jgi:hypothetical protein